MPLMIFVVAWGLTFRSNLIWLIVMMICGLARKRKLGFRAEMFATSTYLADTLLVVPS